MDVVLFGVVVPGVENHSLDVLSRALAQAELAHRVLPFHGFAAMDEMVAEVIAAAPRVCGLSLQTTEAALAVLTFAKLLRRGGYRGTIVVGGHLATLAGDAILGCDAVDVVVELAGEQALVGLARGEDPHTLPGTRTRSGRGTMPLPVPIQALRRTRLSEHLGFGAADLIISRGCPAHCGYCCVSTVSNTNERAGAGRHLVRDLDAIADEIADVAALGGRAFHFMDDNILPLDPDAALAWVRALHDALATRRVPPIAFSLQLRADVVTPELADALAELGLARAYVGIDGYSAGQLRAIGRHATADAGTRALDLLAARGILCVANALLVGPTIGYDTIVREIDGLARVRHAPVHLLPIEARPGTVYHQRAAARGLIEGGPLWPAYRFDDERSFLIGEVITRLPTRLVERSIPIALYDLAWALGVARRLAPTVDITAGLEIYARVTEAWNADQIRLLRAAASAAPEGRDAIEQLIARELPVVTAHDTALLRACDDALEQVERALSAFTRRPVRAHTRGRLLGSLAFSMGLAAAACSPNKGASTDASVVDTTSPDAPWTCADSTHTPSTIGPLTNDCTCITPKATTQVQYTFDGNGLLVSVSDQSGNPLPQNIQQCFLDLVAGYCFPAYAGTVQHSYTCHMWIA